MTETHIEDRRYKASLVSAEFSSQPAVYRVIGGYRESYIFQHMLEVGMLLHEQPAKPLRGLIYREE